jgi:signal transduction histidine kinase
MSQRPPTARHRPVSRTVLIVAMLVVFAVLLVVAFNINKTATDEMVDSHQSQQEVLVRQFAIGMEEIIAHTTQALVRMAKNISSVPVEDEHIIEELGITWDILGTGGLVVLVDLKDLKGNIISSFSDTPMPGLQGLVMGVHEQVVETGQPVISELIGVSNEAKSFYVSVPVVGSNNQVVGTLGALVSLGKLMGKAFQALEKDEIGAFWIITSQGVVLHHSSHPEMTLRNVNDAQSCGPCHQNFEVEQRMLRGEEGHGRTVVEGETKLVAFVPINIQGSLWSIAISNPMGKATHLLSRTNRTFALFLALSLIVMLLGGFFVLRINERAIRAEERALNSARLLQDATEKERLGRELEQANRMATLGEMVARVAHEVKNPVQYIGTGFELLNRENDPQIREEMIADIRSGLTSLDSIIQELLLFSRPMKLELFPTDVRQLLLDVADRLPDTIAVKVTASESMPAVTLDGIKTTQMLTNLVGNAVDAMDGDGDLHLSAQLDSSHLVLAVRDFGRGIAPEDIDKVFDPFFTTKSKGVGLGMNVVGRIVELHGAHIEMQSRLGEGTTFTVRIPANMG